MPQNDVPYEVRMKHIIEAYRKEHKMLEELVPYAKKLEEENAKLKQGIPSKPEPKQVELSDIEKENKELKEKVKMLENRIEGVYKPRRYKTQEFKAVIRSQEDYIKNLQKLLDENGISYHEKTPINDLEAEGVDKIDDFEVL